MLLFLINWRHANNGDANYQYLLYKLWRVRLSSTGWELAGMRERSACAGSTARVKVIFRSISAWPPRPAPRARLRRPPPTPSDFYFSADAHMRARTDTFHWSIASLSSLCRFIINRFGRFLSMKVFNFLVAIAWPLKCSQINLVGQEVAFLSNEISVKTCSNIFYFH